ncbi:hypothetical protein E4U19_000172 [Claviceps sp. Clav32 group G5]|nr:hypothetical protein E4U19_000172 [Claviceps sp. Clav32 group G5]
MDPIRMPQHSTPVWKSRHSTSTNFAHQVTNGTPSDRRTPYVPQFTTSSPLILSRIRNTNGEIKRPALRGGFTSSANSPRDVGWPISGVPSTIAMPNGVAALNDCWAARVRPDAIASAPCTHKRKRADYEIPDFTQKTIPFSAHQISSTPVATTPQLLQPLAPLAQPAPVKDDPPSASAVQPPRSSDSRSPWERETTELSPEEELSSVADGVVSGTPQLGGYPGGVASDLARTRYFMQKNRTDLLKLLSFCDRLRPQLLVDIMVSVSKKHPDLPMFDSPDWQRTLHDSLSSQTESVIKAEPRAVGRVTPRHGHTTVNPRARHRQKHAKKTLRRLILAQTTDDAPPTGLKVENLDGSAGVPGKAQKDAVPSFWPKAGEGLYAKLPLETEDRRYLIDANDDEAFSQFLLDRAGKPVMVSACA